MSTALSPEAVIRAWFDEVWNQGKTDAIDRLMAPHAVAHDLGPADMLGPGPFKQYHAGLRQALGDMKIDVLRTVAEGPFAVAYCEVKARHVGEMAGIPASNKAVGIRGMTMVRVENGQIVEGWNCFDFLKLYQDIGAVALPAQA